MFAPALTLIGAALTMATAAAAPPARPQGPCDIYGAAGTPCVTAHSTTRALYAAYDGPLYQVKRQSDGKTLDIGVVKPAGPDAGGYADATAQDAFCVNTICVINLIYDQSGKGNHLPQAPPGPSFAGPAKGGYDTQPIADMAPITIGGHKAYGVFIMPGMGFRNNDATGLAIADEPEGMYSVMDATHFDSGCCFDYGNAETDSSDDGDGTMETTYYGNQGSWFHGPPPGPWVMTDQENNLVGCANPNSNSKLCSNLPSITWRFVTAMAKGEPHHWTSMGGDSQQGALAVMFNGPRVGRSYDPMRKQGGILLGNGGDNSNGSQGTFYEGAMTAAGTFPSDATDQLVQANVVAAKYDAQRLSVAPASATTNPPGVQTFALKSSQNTTVTFRNTAATPATGVELSIVAPAGWAGGASKTHKTVAPGVSVSATFKITSGSAPFNGDLIASASWTANGQKQTETTIEKVRNVSPVKINEYAATAGSPSNSSDSFIELYNADKSAVDISGWTLTEHPIGQAIFSAVKMPAGAKIEPRGFYVLGLSTSGLAVPAHKGDATIYVRSVAGLNVGDTIEIDTGAGVETRKIASVGTAAGNPMTLWQSLPDGPIITVPAGSKNVPYAAGGGGFGGFGGGVAIEPGQKLALGYGASYPVVLNTVEKYEIVTVTAVGKPGTQTYLAANAKAGDTSIRVRNAANITAGDIIRLDIDSVGHGIETVTVASVGAQAAPANGAPGGGFGGRGASPSALELTAPLKFDHAANMPFSARGTGISFEPATAFSRASNEPLLPLGTGVTLDRPLASDHDINAVVRDAAVKTAGFQGTPNHWFGGPAIANAGAMVLRDSAGLVVDSLNFGGFVDPWAGEGYHETAGAGQGACSAPAPSAGGGFGRRGGQAPSAPARSSGRFPDGADTDSNCRDFHVQAGSSLAIESAAGEKNIKVSSVDFAKGQTIYIDAGENRESAVISAVGTAGGATVNTATVAGSNAIPVASAAGFAAGQTITIDSGANLETAVVVSISGGRRGGFGGPGGPGGGAGSIIVTAPLKFAHAEGAKVTGSGITLASALTKAHAGGAQVSGGLPTPGAPNQYYQKAQ